MRERTQVQSVNAAGWRGAGLGPGFVERPAIGTAPGDGEVPVTRRLPPASTMALSPEGLEQRQRILPGN
jgi:hypothetical protein